MISREIFDAIVEKANGLAYSSMSYIDFDDCESAEILHDDDDFIFLRDKSKSPAMLYFAANDFVAVVNAIAGLSGSLRLHFVPRRYDAELKELGFIEWAEFVDFWNDDITKTASRFDGMSEAEYLSENECKEATEVSKRCELQSRGFEAITAELFSQWLREGKVIICRKNSAIVGFCSISIYNEGTILWIRAIAVDPVYQGQGIGKKLMEQAIISGVQKGAAKGFLASDLLNTNAHSLFTKYDFCAKDAESELQMVRII